MSDRTPHDVLRELLKEDAEVDESCALVLDLGADFDPREPPPGTPQAEWGNCYHAAHDHANNARLRYCEGWTRSADFPNTIGRPHAWCIDPAGRVVDPTFVGRRSDVDAYRGVVIPLEVAAPHISRGAAGTLMAYRDKGEIHRLHEIIAAENLWERSP